MSNWFRFYDDAVNDPKIIDLTDDLYRAWVNLLCIAAKNDGVLPEIKHVALVLRVKPTKAAALITKLVAVDLIDNHGGIFAPHNWQGRQFKSDDSGPRVKRHREKLRNAKRNEDRNVTDVAESNAPEEKQKRIEDKQSRADASAPIDEDLGRRVAALKLQIEGLFRAHKQAVPALDRCQIWLVLGHQPNLICQSVEKVLKRGKPVSTLDYFDGAIRDTHAAAPSAPLQVVSQQEFIVESTMEWNCWEQHLYETTGRGSPCTDNRDERGILRRGWFRPTKVPSGYDEATGERIAPSQSEDAA